LIHFDDNKIVKWEESQRKWNSRPKIKKVNKKKETYFKNEMCDFSNIELVFRIVLKSNKKDFNILIRILGISH